MRTWRSTCAQTSRVCGVCSNCLLGSLSAVLAKNETRALRVSEKTLHVCKVTSQDIRSYRCGPVRNPKHNNFGAGGYAQRLEVGIPCDEHAVLLLRVLQDCSIGRATQAAQADVGRVWKDVSERSDKPSREILVEEQRAHARLGGGQRDGTSLASRGEREGGADVIGRERRVLSDDLRLTHATSKEAENIADRNACAAHARLAEANAGIDDDAVTEVHAGA